jgi:hypothetical protein
MTMKNGSHLSLVPAANDSYYKPSRTRRATRPPVTRVRSRTKVYFRVIDPETGLRKEVLMYTVLRALPARTYH